MDGHDNMGPPVRRKSACVLGIDDGEGLIDSRMLMAVPQEMPPPLTPSWEYAQHAHANAAASSGPSADLNPMAGGESSNAAGSPSQQKAIHDGDGKGARGAASLDAPWFALQMPPKVTRVVAIATFVVALYGAFDRIKSQCIAPSTVLYHPDAWFALAHSPFYVPRGSWVAIALAAVNFVVLAQLEASFHNISRALRVSHPVRAFAAVFLGVVVPALMALRVLLGWTFTRATGWAHPGLFFSDAIHECSDGLAPYLFALTVMHQFLALRLDSLGLGPHVREVLGLPRATWVRVALLLLNAAQRNIFWWAMTGVIVGLLVSGAGFAIGAVRDKLSESSSSAGGGYQKVATSTSPSSSGLPSRERVAPPQTASSSWTASMLRLLRMMSLVLGMLLLANLLYQRRDPVPPHAMATLGEAPFLLTFVVMTAPRPGGARHLVTTLKSYLDQLPEDPAPGSVHSKITFMVYTHFTNHPVFDYARDSIGQTPKGRRYLRWHREQGTKYQLARHVSAALRMVSSSFPTTYVALLEDDFELCPGAWDDLERTLWEGTLRSPNHCGMFVATGGSGLIFRRETAATVASVLISNTTQPPDNLMQMCLIGDVPECAHCRNSLVISRTMLMRHTGHRTSTMYHKYSDDMYQCGWRHPFNGNPDFITI